MSVPFRKQVKIAKLPENPGNRASSTGFDADARERDMRPGRYTVKGTFIKLPDRDDANSRDLRR